LRWPDFFCKTHKQQRRRQAHLKPSMAGTEFGGPEINPERIQVIPPLARTFRR
jgi:hypothetical protein